MQNEALKIADIPFTVTSQIQRAPHRTMIRELTMNAIEAARRYFNQAADHMGLSQNMRKLLLTPKREAKVQIPIQIARVPRNRIRSWANRATRRSAPPAPTNVPMIR